MSKIYDYAQSAVDIATPYVKAAGGYASDMAKCAGENIRKINKKAKRKMRIIKIKNFLEIVSNIILVVAFALAILSTVLEYFKKRENN